MIKSMIFGEEAENLLNEKLNVEAMENPMFCLSNAQKMNGASLLLQEDIRKQIGECWEVIILFFPLQFMRC